MKSPLIKYAIAALGVLFLLSASEVSSEECQRNYNSESHVFVGTENVLVSQNISKPALQSHQFIPLIFTLTEFASVGANHSVDVFLSAALHSAHQAVPLYIDISSLRI